MKRTKPTTRTIERIANLSLDYRVSGNSSIRWRDCQLLKVSFLCAVFLIGVFANSALAHRDSPIRRLPSGIFVGAPEQFGQIRFDIARDQDGSATRVAFSAGQNKFTFPSCLHRLFDDIDHTAIRASGSWYHDLSILPPYVNFEIGEASSDTHGSAEIEFFFDLVTAEPIEFEEIVHREEESTEYE